MQSTIGRSGGWSVVIAAMLVLMSCEAIAADGDVPVCAPVVGRVVSRQGNVEIRRAGSSQWYRVERLDTNVCDGDAVRTGPRSRAALWLQPENLIRLDQKTAITMYSTKAETRVEFFSNGQVSADPDCGAAYFISRFPRKFGVRTPFLSAAIKGTEFLVNSQCSATTLAVFEGAVAAQELQTDREFRVDALQQISVGPGLPSAIPIPIKPRDGVQWTIYYPRTAGRRKDGQDALLEQCPRGAEEAACEIGNVEALLGVGAVDDANAAIGRLQDTGNGGADRAALESVIQIALNDREAALRLAESAVQANPGNARARAAQSYAKQAKLDPEGALEAAERAFEIDGSAFSKARVSELLLVLGRVSKARRAADMAVSLDANEPRALQMLGFTSLANLMADDALSAFKRAIDLDSSDPYSRLGSGLARIRLGHLEDGLAELQIASLLDPSNSLIRSYLGKALFEKRRSATDALAGEQFILAKRLDPLDPTPWLYNALRLARSSEPVRSMEETQRSKELNDRRAPYRSRLLLDDDAAVRSADLVRSYRDLGFGQVAEKETFGVTATDPTSFAGHRLLAEAFYERPRHSAAQVSEALQAQVWQPLNASPLQIDRLDDSSFILRGAGPGSPGLNEYSSLFTQEGVHAQGSGLVGSNNTRGHQAGLSILSGSFAASLGSFAYETDGIQSGWGLEKKLLNGYLQIQPTSDSSVFVEARKTQRTQGDLQGNFFGEIQSLRLLESRQLTRVGGRVGFDDTWSMAAVGTYLDGDSTTEFPAGSELIRIKGPEHSFELQAVRRLHSGWFMMGAGHYRAEGTTTFLGSPSNAASETGSVYAYGGFEPIPSMLRVDLGLSVDRVQDGALSTSIERTNPKLGFVFKPIPRLSIRAASLRNTRKGAVADQTIEPSNVAGFNQLYDDSLGTASRRNGIAIDYAIDSTTFAGVEGTRRNFNIPQFFTNPQEFFEWREREARAYLYVAPSERVATTIEYIYERITEHPQFFQTFLDVRTRRIPIGVRVFSPALNTMIGLTATHVSQDGLFLKQGVFQPAESSFWVADVSASYQLPRRMGVVSLEVRNLFNKSYLFQETDILKPTLARQRFAFLRISIFF